MYINSTVLYILYAADFFFKKCKTTMTIVSIKIKKKIREKGISGIARYLVTVDKREIMLCAINIARMKLWNFKLLKKMCCLVGRKSIFIGLVNPTKILSKFLKVEVFC